MTNEMIKPVRKYFGTEIHAACPICGNRVDTDDYSSMYNHRLRECCNHKIDWSDVDYRFYLPVYDWKR